MTQQISAKVTVGSNDGQSSPLVSPLSNARDKVVPHEPPNGKWYVPNPCWGMFVPSWYPQSMALIHHLIKKHLSYLTHVKDIDCDAHIQVFKKAMKANGKIINENIINLFIFTFKDNIF
jgi:hypothetical protein